MLAYMPGQRAHDCPKVGTRVFKFKLTELLDDITKNQVFGESRTVVYFIEFQKRGLPHVHILLWLEEHCKCKTASDIDDIISAELPSPMDDPVGYKSITDYMLHGPCGKDAKSAACNVEGKCSKHFPKPFYKETVIDQDGHPIYHLRDNKMCVKKGINVIMFTDWFDLNERHSPDRTLTYAEIPQHYVWHEQSKMWKPQKQREWTRAIQEASLWALRTQLRDLFMTILLFCDLTTEQIQNYCLLEIQELLNRNGRSLTEFQDLPRPNRALLTNMDNHLIREALAFDMNKSKIQHQQLYPQLNPEQRIASLLLPGGRTAHSRFVIPLKLLENNTCGINQNTHLAELMQEVDLIIWYEAPMTQKYAFEALDKTLRDILGYPTPEKQNKIY
ncbi:ATP-dependent DNA helicase PIF1-like protein [Tanacetum coccineum]